MTKSDIAIYGYTLLPKSVTMASYKFLLVDSLIMYRGFFVSLFVTGVGTLLCLVFTASLAYGLSKKYLPHRNKITTVVLVTMFFSGGLIPQYLLVSSLGLLDSLWALIIPVLISPWYMFLMRNFFMAIPREVEESAYMDGANDAVVLGKIVIPLSLAPLATIGLFYAVGHWNSWFNAAIYLNTHDKWPMMLILREMIASLDFKNVTVSTNDLLENQMNLTQEGVKSAAILLTALPIMCVYPFIQKYFVRGVIVGSLKG